jgi:hypothetical protein
VRQSRHGDCSYMALYSLVRALKFLAVMTYVAASVASFVAPSDALRKQLAHAVASPALLSIWALGFTLAWLRGTSFGQPWIVAGLVLSTLSNVVLTIVVARGVRTRSSFVACLLPLLVITVLMVLRPRWAALGL